MGGYSGYRPYTILFSNGKAWKTLEGADFGAYGPAKGLLDIAGGAGVSVAGPITFMQLAVEAGRATCR